MDELGAFAIRCLQGKLNPNEINKPKAYAKSATKSAVVDRLRSEQRVERRIGKNLGHDVLGSLQDKHSLRFEDRELLERIQQEHLY